ncbi:TPA: prop effector [Salmonella enterica subsp. salamae serovar 35:g,m,s,t:-]|nr:prop effector [Salmonella enterica subsp. salamae serovar 35:g,m,s,t:-]HCA3549764.1 prop effector [Salmonella enterica subsp. salamae serovar 35:g,m,s,t:-]
MTNQNDCIDKKPLSMNNLSQRNKRYRRRCLARLVELWPQTFNLTCPRPLAHSILDEITDESTSALLGGRGAALYSIKSYIKRVSYLIALTSGEERYNLSGQPDGVVTKDEKARAIQTLNNMMDDNQFFTEEIIL